LNKTIVLSCSRSSALNVGNCRRACSHSPASYVGIWKDGRSCMLIFSFHWRSRIACDDDRWNTRRYYTK